MESKFYTEEKSLQNVISLQNEKPKTPSQVEGYWYFL